MTTESKTILGIADATAAQLAQAEAMFFDEAKAFIAEHPSRRKLWNQATNARLMLYLAESILALSKVEQAVFASWLGNTSQLGQALVKKGMIDKQGQEWA